MTTEQNTATTPADIFAAMPELFDAEPQRLAGTYGTYQFFITGDAGGAWHVSIEDGKAVVAAGESVEPHCTIQILDSDFVNMAQKRVSGGALFMRGRLRVSGSQELAMRAPRIFG